MTNPHPEDLPMLLELSATEIDTTKTALGYADKAYSAVIKACAKVQLSSLDAEGHLNQTGTLLRTIRILESESTVRTCEFPAPQRQVMRVGLQLLLDDIEKTREKEIALGIDPEASEFQQEAVIALARRLGEQLELPEPEQLEEQSEQPELAGVGA